MTVNFGLGDINKLRDIVGADSFTELRHDRLGGLQERVDVMILMREHGIDSPDREKPARQHANRPQREECV